MGFFLFLTSRYDNKLWESCCEARFSLKYFIYSTQCPWNIYIFFFYSNGKICLPLFRNENFLQNTTRFLTHSTLESLLCFLRWIFVRKKNAKRSWLFSSGEALVLWIQRQTTGRGEHLQPSQPYTSILNKPEFKLQKPQLPGEKKSSAVQGWSSFEFKV